MQVSVSDGKARQEIQKAEGVTGAKFSDGKGFIAKGESFVSQDSVEISGEGRVMQKALSNTKVLTMPQETDSNKVTYDNPKMSVEVQEKSSKAAKSADTIRLNQTAASIAQGKTISPVAEKALKEGNPQLYAQAKAKAQIVATQAKEKAEEQTQKKRISSEKA